MDRNVLSLLIYHLKFGSLSARRAWIEIVDPDKDSLTDESLSARRAWIEILVQLGCKSSLNCRSPQGERG